MIDRVTIETGSRQLQGAVFRASGLLDLMMGTSAGEEGRARFVTSSRIFLEEGPPGQVQLAPLEGRILNMAWKFLSWMRSGGPKLASVRAAGMVSLKR